MRADKSADRGRSALPSEKKGRDEQPCWSVISPEGGMLHFGF
jgi:hypothetical protein